MASRTTSKKLGDLWTVFSIPSYLPQQCLVHFLIFVIYFTSTSGCWRRHVSSSDETLPAVHFNYSTTTEQHSHRLDCLPDEVSSAGCLNGGKCYATQLGDNKRSIQCSCTSEWMGEKCDQRNIDPDLWAKIEPESKAAQLAIVWAVGVTAFILLVVLIVVTVIYLRRRQRRVYEFRKKKAQERLKQPPGLQSETSATPLKSFTDMQPQRIFVMPISTV